MKTPDVIKKGLRWCGGIQQVIKGCGGGCPYYMPEDNGCKQEDMHADALAYIQQLEAERDAMMKEIRGRCSACKHFDKECYEPPCNSCKVLDGDEANWQWRGVQKEE